MRWRMIRAGLATLCALLVGPLQAEAASLKTLYSFCAVIMNINVCTDGREPQAGLIMDASGKLYGTTSSGGELDLGTVFELRPNTAKTKWTHEVLYSFGDCANQHCGDGYGPSAGLIMDKSGNLYGTTADGGAHNQGTVFKLAPNAANTKWTETVLYSFCAQGGEYCTDGEIPFAGLIMDKSGNLYGTTLDGGAYSNGQATNGGTVFELTPNAANTKWTETVLYSFCAQSHCTDGTAPWAAGVIMDKLGNLYGTTELGGAGDGGTAFKLTPSAANTAWTEAVLYSFPFGADPFAGVIMDKSGNLYGTTQGGGYADRSTVFELPLGGVETVLHDFTLCGSVSCSDGNQALAGLITDKSGNLYGTTFSGGTEGHSQGTVFELTPSAADTTWVETVLYSFCAQGGAACTDGASPQGGLVRDASGHLYGTTYSGGAYSGYGGGTVFELKK